MIIDIGVIEIRLTLEECDANIFWEMHNITRGVNPHWKPQDEEGNAWPNWKG